MRDTAETTEIDDLTGHEIELINDGDGIAVIGPPLAVEEFLSSRGLESRELGLDRLAPKAGSILGGASGVAQAGAQIAENSGRWIKLTKESAKALNELPAMTGSSGEVARTIVTENGKIKHILEFVRAGSPLNNPAVLAGAAGIMAQMAMQQTMDEIIDYLAVIDAKVDDVLRSQKDAALADMIGVELVIEEAMTIRDQVGFVSEVTWSKVQATTATVAKTQAYALRQLDGLAEKMEKTRKMGDLADLTEDAKGIVHEWLAVLARCFQLQEATGILEIDRVLDESPDDPGEVERHRRALRTARVNRRALIARSTHQLLSRMDGAAKRANTKVLFAPNSSREVVGDSNVAAERIVEFHTTLGIEGDHESVEAKRWLQAADEARGDIVEFGADTVGAVGRFTGEAVDNVREGAGRLLAGLSERLLRKDDDDSSGRETPRAD